ncbi:PAP1-domain-containing protein [Stipitochalara longipes BDJ]|nr:PAP1-domain-containing protein [Stipitochalara longipes BDJ]
MTKKWMDVKGEIERRYLIQRIPLEEVRQQMLKEHGFVASTRAYKEKFKEWGWKTYKKTCSQDPKCAKNPLFRSRPCRKAISPICIQVGFKTLKESIERETTLAVHEKNELGALQHALDNQNFDFAAAEKLSQCTGRLAKIEETLLELRKCMEGVEGIETRKNAPSGFAACWKKDPMILEDALGRFLLIPLDIVVSWEAFEEHLGSFFQVCPGAKKVQKREYAIEDGLTRVAFSKSQHWSLFSTPGRKVDMSMIFKDKSKNSAVCPKCNTISDEQKGKLIECKNAGCRMLFRTEEEDDQPAQRARPGSPHSSGHRRFSIPLMLTGGEDDEDTPGMFKRVIIKVAKLPRHIQSTTTSSLNASHGTDSLWDMFSPESDIALQSSANFDPLQLPFSDGNHIPLDWGEFICSWGQENPSIDYPPTVRYTPPWDTILSMDEGSASFEITPPPQDLIEVRDGTASRPYDMLNNLDALDDILSFETELATAPRSSSSTFLNCNTIWDRLQACPTVKEGEFDLDLLCKDLQKKAKCSETGAVVNESDFNVIMKRYTDQRVGEKARAS